MGTVEHRTLTGILYIFVTLKHDPGIKTMIEPREDDFQVIRVVHEEMYSPLITNPAAEYDFPG